MNTKIYVQRLIQLAEKNGISTVLKNRQILSSFAEKFSERSLRSIMYFEYYEFFRHYSKHYPNQCLANWQEFYNDAFSSGTQNGLPWSLNKPLPELMNFLSFIKKRPLHALDIGCGDGTQAIYLANNQCQVTGIDVSSKALEIARKNAKKAAVKVKFMKINILDLPYQGQYDLILDRGCFHHIPVVDWHSYVQKISQTLKSNGFMLLVTHNHNLFLERCQDFHLGFFSRFLKYICDGICETGFTKAEIRSIFSKIFKIKYIKITDNPKQNPIRDYKFITTMMMKR